MPCRCYRITVASGLCLVLGRTTAFGLRPVLLYCHSCCHYLVVPCACLPTLVLHLCLAHRHGLPACRSLHTYLHFSYHSLPTGMPAYHLPVASVRHYRLPSPATAAPQRPPPSIPHDTVHGWYVTAFYSTLHLQRALVRAIRDYTLFAADGYRTFGCRHAATHHTALPTTPPTPSHTTASHHLPAPHTYHLPPTYRTLTHAFVWTF